MNPSRGVSGLRTSAWGYRSAPQPGATNPRWSALRPTADYTDAPVESDESATLDDAVDPRPDQVSARIEATSGRRAAPSRRLARLLETGARSQKLKVYEMTDHPAARALTGYLLVRGGVHQLAYARALELLTGADLRKMFPTPRIPTEKIPECQPHLRRGEHTKLYRFSPDDYREIVAVWTGSHPETGDALRVVDGPPEGALPHELPPQPAVFAPDYAPEEIAQIAQRLRQGRRPARVADGRRANAEEAGLVETARAVVDKMTS